MRIRLQSDKPVLVFGPVPTKQMVTAAKNGLTLTVGSTDYAERLSTQLRMADITCECHLKIDTGLNRSGIRWRSDNDALEKIKYIYSLTNLNFTGTYTHFACGEGQLDWEKDFTQLQFNRFMQACDTLINNRFNIGLRHCCSTGGSLVHPEYQLDMVRLGMMPLGISYSDESVEELGLHHALKWVSFIAQIGDEVILLGTDGINTISAQMLSEFGESVSGEVTCNISKRVPRIYQK